MRIDEYRTREEAMEAMRLRHEAPAVAPADLSRAPQAAVDALIPFVHVADVTRSIAFYELLDFTVDDTHGVGERLNWASLSQGDGRVMLAGAGSLIDADDQAVLFYLFTAHLPGLQQHLRAHGHRAGAIRDSSPGLADEMRVRDPRRLRAHDRQTRGVGRRILNRCGSAATHRAISPWS
ncbi:MAG: hypothetical protein ACR2OB_01000 [Solirubrobacteraceae bacterium]